MTHFGDTRKLEWIAAADDGRSASFPEGRIAKPAVLIIEDSSLALGYAAQLGKPVIRSAWRPR